MRLWHLGRPKTLSFDETYYAKQAWSMLEAGYAQDYVEKADQRIAAGNLSDLFVTGQPTQIVHPEAGKWLIALGEAAFGMDSFGWRVSAAVVGALTVLVLARLVRRLTGSTVIGCLAGLLLALDGAHFVMSRLALLDGFLTFWIVCAVACLVADHDWMTARLDRLRLFRPWQLLAGVCFGLGLRHQVERRSTCSPSSASPWSSGRSSRDDVTDAPSSADTGRCRRRSLVTSTFAVGIPAFVTLVGVAAVVYVATWSGWLLHHGCLRAALRPGLRRRGCVGRVREEPVVRCGGPRAGLAAIPVELPRDDLPLPHRRRTSPPSPTTTSRRPGDGSPSTGR